MAAGSTRACDRIGPMEEGEGGGAGIGRFSASFFSIPDHWLDESCVRGSFWVSAKVDSRYRETRGVARNSIFPGKEIGPSRVSPETNRVHFSPVATFHHLSCAILKEKKLQNYSNRSCRSFLPIFHPILIRVALAARMKACFAYVYHDGR